VPESTLLIGILLGAEQGLPAELQQAFKASGTSHLIAISGFNIHIIKIRNGGMGKDNPAYYWMRWASYCPRSDPSPLSG